jgi:hypothetical protein
MGRKPDGDMARRHRLTFRFDDIESRIIERRRGKMEVSEYLRHLIREDGRRRKDRDG